MICITLQVDQMVSNREMATMIQEMPFLFSLLSLMIHLIKDLTDIQVFFHHRKYAFIGYALP